MQWNNSNSQPKSEFNNESTVKGTQEQNFAPAEHGMPLQSYSNSKIKAVQGNVLITAGGVDEDTAHQTSDKFSAKAKGENQAQMM